MSATVFGTQLPVVPESYLHGVMTPEALAFKAEQYADYPVDTLAREYNVQEFWVVIHLELAN